MLFQYSTAASLITLFAVSNALTIKRQNTASETTLWAYGGSTNGAPIIFDNGLAYIGKKSLTVGTSTNITFTTNDKNTTVPWTIRANSTAFSFNETLEMYIVPTNGSYEQVGFVSTNGTVPTGGVTTGFTFIGTQVAYAASESNYETQFWATASNETGIYGLYWNANGSPQNGSFPVVVKTTPPTVL